MVITYTPKKGLGTSKSEDTSVQIVTVHLKKTVVSVRSRVTSVLGSAFSCVPDKQKAWDDLHRLTTDGDSNVRSNAVSAIGSAYSNVPDKQKAWDDLHRLTTDGDSNVRFKAASAIGSAYYNVPDKQKALGDLHRLTTDRDSNVRSNAASAIGSAYSNVSDKQKAWDDLIKLTTDGDSDVRVYTNHSLGKVSIFKTSQAKIENDYKKELEQAIAFFEKAAQESTSKWLNPSQFCLPFYRSFHTIIFKKQEAKEEVDKYLAETKAAVRSSKNKELLFEAVENLANALKEIQNLKNVDLEAEKCELKFYRQYCDRAAELMKDTEEKAPFATEAMRRGLPILDRNLKELLEEIQKKAKIACKESKGTAAEEIARAVNKEVQKWEIGSQEYLKTQIESLIFLLKSYVPKIEEKCLILNRIDKILNEPDIVKQYTLLNNLIPQIMDIQKTSSYLEENQKLRNSVVKLVDSISELQNPQEYLDTIQQNLEVIKNEIPEMEEKIEKVLYELYSPLSTDQKLKIAIPIIPSLVSYELETNVPKLVADKINILKNLVLRIKNR